jgi:hypothetical protein
MLNESGFAKVEVKQLLHDFQNSYYIVTKRRAGRRLRQRALNLMARVFPDSRFVGYDISEDAIARAEVKEHGQCPF